MPSERLARAGVPDPQVDAELLAAHVLGTGRGGVQAALVRGDALDDAAADELEALVVRRATREPLQHITGLAPFRHLELRVGPGVFVPRPETEIVAQLAIDALRAAASAAPVAVDLGTGSGAIALALATEVPHARVFAAENSVDAFVWTKENFAHDRRRQRHAGVHRPRACLSRARRHGLGRRVEPAIRSGCRHPARSGGAPVRPACGALRRRGRARRGAGGEHASGFGSRTRAARSSSSTASGRARRSARSCPPTAGGRPRRTPI